MKHYHTFFNATHRNWPEMIISFDSSEVARPASNGVRVTITFEIYDSKEHLLFSAKPDKYLDARNTVADINENNGICYLRGKLEFDKANTFITFNGSASYPGEVSMQIDSIVIAVF